MRRQDVPFRSPIPQWYAKATTSHYAMTAHHVCFFDCTQLYSYL